MKSKITILCVTIMLGLFASTSASAAPFYKIGYNAAQGLAETAWNNLGRDCQRVEAFKSIIEDNIRDTARDIGTKYRGRSAEEFASGYQAGLSEVLNKIRSQCRNSNWVSNLINQLEQFVRDLFGSSQGVAGFSHESAVASQGSGSPFYKIGYNAAQGLAETAWNNLGRDCQKVDTFNYLIEDSIRDAARDIGTRYRGRSAEDFASGYQAGLSKVLNKIRSQCRNSNWVSNLINQLEQFVRDLFSWALKSLDGNVSNFKPSR